MTASVIGPTLGQPIALAMLRGSIGDDELRAVSSVVAGLDVAVEITGLPFYDDDGGRMRA